MFSGRRVWQTLHCDSFYVILLTTTKYKLRQKQDYCLITPKPPFFSERLHAVDIVLRRFKYSIRETDQETYLAYLQHLLRN